MRVKQALYVETTSDFHEVWCRVFFYTEKLSASVSFVETHLLAVVLT